MSKYHRSIRNLAGTSRQFLLQQYTHIVLGGIASFFDVLDCYVQDSLHSHSVCDRRLKASQLASSRTRNLWSVFLCHFQRKNSFRLFGNKAWLINVNFAIMFVKFLLIRENLLAPAEKGCLIEPQSSPSSLEYSSPHGPYRHHQDSQGKAASDVTL